MHPETSYPIDRRFTTAVFVVSECHVLLLFHRKLQLWLPPGGHIDPGEIPDDSAVREVWEETGLPVALVGRRAFPDRSYPRQLIIPEGVQLTTIAPGREIIDLIYFAVPVAGGLPAPQLNEREAESIGWYRRDEILKLGANDEIQAWALRAIDTFSARDVT